MIFQRFAKAEPITRRTRLVEVAVELCSHFLSGGKDVEVGIVDQGRGVDVTDGIDQALFGVNKRLPCEVEFPSGSGSRAVDEAFDRYCVPMQGLLEFSVPPAFDA